MKNIKILDTPGIVNEEFLKKLLEISAQEYSIFFYVKSLTQEKNFNERI